jgi:hypothetical protein
MQQQKIELRQSRDLGDLITIYFDFLKLNFKNFTSIFITYNGLFILAFLLISYMLVTGFMGMASSSPDNQTDTFLIGAGVVLFFIVFIIVSALNYSLASAYAIQYVNTPAEEPVEKTTVWKRITNNIGSIIAFILFLMLIYTVFMILSIILAFIPILGTLVQYVISFGISSWFGISFMVMLQEKKGVIDSFYEGWDLVKNNFWTCVGTNLVIGLLVGVLILLILTIPGILIGIYTFHAVQTDFEIVQSVPAKIIYTLGLTFFLLALAFSQALSQFINSILYFSLHEKTYNQLTRAKIEEIGKSE